jgi:sodium-dependent dicarboxylate transporter 2/3/5
MSREEKWVAAIFGLTGLLWIFRIDLHIGQTTMPGWTNLLNLSSTVDDGTIAIVMALFLFLIPARKDGEKSRLVTNAIFKKIPWDVVLLFGGGFALAQGLTSTGLSQWFGDSLFNSLGNVSQIPMIAGIATTMTFTTEVTSNTALSQMIQPILASIAKSQGIAPMLIMVPAALSISMAFMLPVATPPNAIVFGSGRITIRQMVLAGIILDLIGVGISVLAVYLIGIPLLT